MDPIAQAFASHGIPGLVIAGLIYWVKRLQDSRDAENAARLADAKGYTNELKAAADARLADAKAYTDRALALQEAVHDSVSKLSELIEMVSAEKAPAVPRPRGRFPSSSGA